VATLSLPTEYRLETEPPRLLRGIEAGILGGFAMLALLILGSLLRGHVWWEIPNVLGSTFYGTRAFRSGPGVATVSGAALHFVITGSIGALFGLACGGIQQRRRLVLLGLMAGIIWYYLGAGVFWSRINPWVPAIASQPIAILSHAVFGACLGRMARKFGRPTLDPKLPEESSEPNTPFPARDAVE
jgi:hypothetical protein